MNEAIEPENTEFVLPIVCTHCGKENNLSMMFNLLAPEMAGQGAIINDRDDDDSDEEINDMPPLEEDEEA